MMREIIFRGKRLGDGEWVTGGLIVWPGGDASICVRTADNETMIKAEVDPATVGQYTGLTDKNGKRIFEGDIVAIPGSNRKGLPAPIWYDKSIAAFVIRRMGYKPIFLWDVCGWCEVIGNVHDNQELLEC